MTEDDTFNALVRTPIPEMLRYYSEWVTNNNGTFEGLEEMCKRNGWRWIDFSVAGARWREEHK